jgi:hypothetical protein
MLLIGLATATRASRELCSQDGVVAIGYQMRVGDVYGTLVALKMQEWGSVMPDAGMISSVLVSAPAVRSFVPIMR